MAFGFGKLAVLESKLDIYEDLSKEMLEKLERAVFTISENSNKVSVILERHESRLDESQRSDQLIIKMIEEMKDTEEKNQKFVIAAGAVLTTAIALLTVIPPIIEVLTPPATASRMGSEIHRTT